MGVTESQRNIDTTSLSQEILKFEYKIQKSWETIQGKLNQRLLSQSDFNKREYKLQEMKRLVNCFKVADEELARFALTILHTHEELKRKGVEIPFALDKDYKHIFDKYILE